MITCQHARQIFDRYLDDELSPSLQAELHAHVINCTPCQNHLALIEACGDVIRLDKCEPLLGRSFTDRVLAARREQAAAVPGRAGSRGLGRLGWWIGGPMAAAASIVLVVMLGGPVFNRQAAPKPPTVVGGAQAAAPAEFRKNIQDWVMTPPMDPRAKEELQNTPQMKALTYLQALLEGTRNAVAGTRQGYEDVQLLVRYGFKGMNDRLLAEYREKYPDVPQQEAWRVINDWDIQKLAIPQESPVEESSSPEVSPSPSAPSNASASPDAI